MNVDFHYLKIGFLEYLRISGEIRYPNGAFGHWKKVTIWKEACIVHVGAIIHDYQGEGASWSRKCLWWKDYSGNLTSLNTDNVNFCTRSRPYQREASRPSGPGRFFLDFVVSLAPLIGTQKQLFSVFLALLVGFKKRRTFFPRHILPINPYMHTCPCSWALGVCKPENTGIRTNFGSVTVESARGFCHFAFWHHRFKFATFFIVHINCILWGASFKIIKNLATLNPEKLQGFHGIPLSHCYTLPKILDFAIFQASSVD